MINKYVLGNEVRIVGAFTNLLGAAADPTTLTLSIRQPDNTVLTKTYPADVVKDSTGNYHYDFLPSQAGSHSYRYAGAGAVVAAGESQFIITPSIVL